MGGFQAFRSVLHYIPAAPTARVLFSPLTTITPARHASTTTAITSTSTSPPPRSKTPIPPAASAPTTPSIRAKYFQIPTPTPFCPDVPTFLTLIGRNLKTHASKFPSWESLFSLTSEQLRELGVEPARSRRYLIKWRQRLQRGQYGIAGDMRHVSAEGAAELRVLEHPRSDKVRAPVKFVVNVPEGKLAREVGVEEMARVKGYKVQGKKTIVGPWATPMKRGEGAVVRVTEGMWQYKQPVKVDGGERRKAMVRYLRRIAERREEREKGGRRG